MNSPHRPRCAPTAWLRERTSRPDGQPGLALVVPTFGDFLLWHPHAQAIASAGALQSDPPDNGGNLPA